jgi:hypothetical protein
MKDLPCKEDSNDVASTTWPLALTLVCGYVLALACTVVGVGKAMTPTPTPTPNQRCCWRVVVSGRGRWRALMSLACADVVVGVCWFQCWHPCQRG